MPASSSASAKDRKSTRLNSSHQIISYAVFCLKKKKIIVTTGVQNHVQGIVREGNVMLLFGNQFDSTDPAPAPADASRTQLEQILDSLHFTVVPRFPTC